MWLAISLLSANESILKPAFAYNTAFVMFYFSTFVMFLLYYFFLLTFHEFTDVIMDTDAQTLAQGQQTTRILNRKQNIKKEKIISFFQSQQQQRKCHYVDVKWKHERRSRLKFRRRWKGEMIFSEQKETKHRTEITSAVKSFFSFRAQTHSLNIIFLYLKNIIILIT